MKKSERISWLNLGAPAEPPEVKGVFDRTMAKIGYVRYSQQVVANLPAVLAAQEALSRALMQDENLKLSRKERELIALVVSVENSCDSCTFGHASQLRAITGDSLWVGRVQANYRRAPLSARERAIADYAVKVTRAASEVEPTDLETLRLAGLTEIEILHAAAIAAYFNFSNRINSGLGIEPNAEAYFASRGDKA